MGYAIQADGLAKRYGETRALDGVDLEVPQGRLLGVLGPNGAGKTTAVRILATLVRPDGGGARVSGFDVVRRAHQVRSLIGLTGRRSPRITFVSARTLRQFPTPTGLRPS
ncbi:hypothetical protein GCM10027612_66350 [Microbispora bryophytorum subsp. camponoti]